MFYMHHLTWKPEGGIHEVNCCGFGWTLLISFYGNIFLCVSVHHESDRCHGCMATAYIPTTTNYHKMLPQEAQQWCKSATAECLSVMELLIFPHPKSACQLDSVPPESLVWHRKHDNAKMPRGTDTFTRPHLGWGFRGFRILNCIDFSKAAVLHKAPISHFNYQYLLQPASPINRELY